MTVFSRLILAGLFSTSVAFAQTIPEADLKANFQECQTGCQKNGQGENVCKFICQCTVDKFKEALQYEPYLALMAEMKEKRLSPESQVFLIDIGRRCNAELDKAMPAPITRLPKPIKKKNQ